MDEEAISAVYRAYIDCLNARDWPSLGRFVADTVRHNGRTVGAPGYRAMLERNVDDIPDLNFKIVLQVVEPPFLAIRLDFDCTPRGTFLELPINGRRVSFSEKVFYRFEDGKITEVWSVIDKAAIEAQL